MRRARLLLIAIAALVCASALPALGLGQDSWLCKPGKADNPCDVSLNTTLLSPTGKKLGVEHVKAPRHPKFDCFYVYPTVSDQKTATANFDIDPELRSIALYQAARYSSDCRVFAPVYRQITLPGLLGHGQGRRRRRRARLRRTSATPGATTCSNYNHGRGVVLIGHSQGSFVLRQLVAKEIDPKPRCASGSSRRSCSAAT